MNKINILDCTLRDGGYVNQWKFGKRNIVKIMNRLIESNIDIVECGFLTEKSKTDDDSSLYNSIAEINGYLPEDKGDSLIVCMINYGEYDVTHLPQNDGAFIDGIRVSFHKKDMKEALKFCEEVRMKGYKLFMQPMVTLVYSDEEYLQLIREANRIHPYAFYIVDSFGVMKRKDLMRLYYLVDHNLDKDIFVGYHSHNNLQMAYSNAQALVDLNTKRKIIIDSSVFGMGRGAGNLNTELFIEYINDIKGFYYKAKPLLQIIDEILAPVYLKNYWGYSLPHYISAIHNCHPNYASYLDDKNTLNVENINEILGGLDTYKKNVFDKEHIENLYNQYQAKITTDGCSKKKLKEVLVDKTVLLIAPGKSINSEKEKIIKAMLQPDTVTISINFKPNNFDCDYVFVSNLRRYEELKNTKDISLIVTSNIIRNENVYGYVVNYSDLLNNIDAVEDNAGMMLIKLLIDLNVNHIKIAGLDGYSHDIYENYAKPDMAFIKNDSVMDAKNIGIEKMLRIYADSLNIEFVTTPKYIKLN